MGASAAAATAIVRWSLQRGKVSNGSNAVMELLSYFLLAMGMYKGRKCNCSSRKRYQAWKESGEGWQRGNLYRKEKTAYRDTENGSFCLVLRNE